MTAHRDPIAGTARPFRDRLAVLRWSATTADGQRHSELTRRFPAAYVIRAQALRDVRASLAAFDPTHLPVRNTMFSLVVNSRGIEFWAGDTQPFRFLLLPWPAFGIFALRSFVDFPVRDLLALDGGHVTTLVIVPVGDRTLELALWGDERQDSTESLLDEYGLRTALARIERLRPGFVPLAAVGTESSGGGRRLPRPPVALPAVALTRHAHRWSVRRRR